MPATIGVSWTTYFAPFDDTTGAFLQFVAAAQKSVKICIYGFHLPALTDCLIEKHKAGLDIGIILDHTQAAGTAEHTEVQRLIDAGVPLLIGTSPKSHQILHAKFCVVDGQRVEHGSWNYSLSASLQLNDMHLINDADYARVYLEKYEAIRHFILLHEMDLQPEGETPATAALSLVPPAATQEPAA